jgi:hypothetical protein
MNIFVNRILGFGLLTALAGGLQAAEQAKFHLPMAVTWGSVVLQPGDYSVSLPQIGVAHREFVLNNQGKTMFIPVMSTQERVTEYSSSDKSRLLLRNINGTYYVESYQSGPREKEFSFKLPKTGVRVQYGKHEVVKLDVPGE